MVFLRTRGLLRATGVLLLVAVAGAAVPAEPVPVRFRLAAVGLGPIVAALPGALLPTLLDRPERHIEPVRTSRLRGARAAWLGVLLVLFSVTGQLALGGGPGALLVSARSLGLVGGLGLLVAQRSPAVAAWLPGALVIVVTLVYGTATMSGTPYRWALLLYPAGSRVAALTSALLLVTGSVVYVWRDAHPSR